MVVGRCPKRLLIGVLTAASDNSQKTYVNQTQQEKNSSNLKANINKLSYCTTGAITHTVINVNVFNRG